VAAILRLLFLYANLDRDWPYSIFFFGDSRHYHLYAVALVRGELYDQGIPFHPPLFPWLLHLVYRMLGIPQGSALPYKLCLVGVNALTVGLAWAWYRRLLGEAWALVGASWLIVAFGWLLLSSSYNSEVLLAPLSIATCWLAWQRREALGGPGALGLGALMGFGWLTHAAHGSSWPFVLTYLFLLRRRDVPLGRHARQWLIAVVVSLVVVAPWTLRNHARIAAHNAATPLLEPLSTFAPVSAYGPLNFALANHDEADGGFSPRRLRVAAATGGIDLTDPGQRALFIHGYSIGARWIVAHPAAALRLAGAKLDRWLDGLRLGFGVSSFPSGLRGERAPVDLFVPEWAWLKWPLLLALLGGVVLSSLRATREYLICSLVMAHGLAITLLFYGYARSWMALLGVLVPLWLLPCARRAASRPAASIWAARIAMIVVLLALLHGVTVVARGPRDFVASGPSDAAGRILQDERIELWPRARQP
jgi:hypothetical protein